MISRQAQKRIVKTAGNCLILYVVLLGLLFFLQRDLLYNIYGSYTSPAKLGLDDVQEVVLTAADKVRIQAWYRSAPEGAKTIIFFQGNGGGLVRHRRMFDAMAKHGMGFLSIAYRGYPGSEGKPTEAGIYDDARAAMAFIERQGIAAEKRVLMGLSLGTGVAVQMAVEYDAGLLVLAAPFTSITDVASARYWYAPVRYMLHDPFDSLSKIGKIRMPLYVFHSTDDYTVPYALGERLYDAAKGQKHLFTLQGEGHNRINFDFIMQQIEERPRP